MFRITEDPNYKNDSCNLVKHCTRLICRYN